MQWRSIEGYEGMYEVSDGGEVRSLPRSKAGRYRSTQGTMLSPALTGSGYFKVCLCDGKRREQPMVHRLVLEAFRGQPHPGQESRHLDGDRTNNALPNLVWGTRVQNAADRRRHGTLSEGDRHYAYRLTPEIIADAKAQHAKGDGWPVIAQRLGFHHVHLAKVCRTGSHS